MDEEEMELLEVKVFIKTRRKGGKESKEAEILHWSAEEGGTIKMTHLMHSRKLKLEHLPVVQATRVTDTGAVFKLHLDRTTPPKVSEYGDSVGTAQL